ncbi:hypothetical protein ACFLZX_01100 [Nanoarchaeota archaeon]
MLFDKQKTDILGNQDKSIKKSIDKDIAPLVDKITKSKNYFTTSSCSGRICILAVNDKHLKNKSRWLYITHKSASFKDIKKSLKKIKNLDLWFMQESMILHVVCRTIEDALFLVQIAKDAGFKRSGIVSVGNKILVEISSTEKIETPIAKKGKIIVTDSYFKILIKEANKKLKRTKEKIKKVKTTFSSL